MVVRRDPQGADASYISLRRRATCDERVTIFALLEYPILLNTRVSKIEGPTTYVTLNLGLDNLVLYEVRYDIG